MNDQNSFGFGTWFQFSRRARLELCKLFTGLLLFLSFFLQVNTFGFTFTIGMVTGASYYLLCETQPQIMMVISMLIKYQMRHIFKKIHKLWLKITTFLCSKSELQTKLRIDDNFNSLEYYDWLKDKKYIYLFNENLRSNDLIIFRDELNNDITDHIEPYLGPMQDFHGVKLTPGDFNHKKITIFRDGEINLLKTFEEHEAMVWS
jgi:hypothetical protein